MSDRIPTAEQLAAIADALQGFLATEGVYELFSDDPMFSDDPAVFSIDVGVALVGYRILSSFARLERALNPGRVPWRQGEPVAIFPTGWPEPVQIGILILCRLVDQIIHRWDVPEICEDRPVMHGHYSIGDGDIIDRPHKPYTLTDEEKERLGWCLAAFEFGLGTVYPEENGPTAPSTGVAQPTAIESTAMTTAEKPRSGHADWYEGLSILRPRFAEHAGSDLRLFVARGFLPRDRFRQIERDPAGFEWLVRGDGLFGLPDDRLFGGDQIGEARVIKDFGITDVTISGGKTREQAKDLVLVQRFVLYGSAQDRVDAFVAAAVAAGVYLVSRTPPALGGNDHCLDWLTELSSRGFAAAPGCVPARRLHYGLHLFDDLTGTFWCEPDDRGNPRRYKHEWGVLSLDVFSASMRLIDALVPDGGLDRGGMVNPITDVYQCSAWAIDLILAPPPSSTSSLPGLPEGEVDTEPPREKNRRVRDYLQRHPTASSEEVGKALGIPPQTVRRQSAWKERPDKKQPKPGRSGVRERSLTRKMLATRPGDDPDPSELAAEGDELAVFKAPYLDTLTQQQKAEFFGLSPEDQLERIGGFMAEADDPSP